MAVLAVEKRSRSWGDALLGRPWLVVAAVVLAIAMPVLILGQASENDTRARFTTAQIASVAHAAEVVSSSFNDREALLQATVAALALQPRPDASPIGLAVQRGDLATLQALADTVQHLYARNVLRAYIAVRGEADTLANGAIVVASPANTGLVGQGLPPNRLVNCRRGCNATDFFVTGGLSDDYPGSEDAPSGENIA